MRIRGLLAATAAALLVVVTGCGSAEDSAGGGSGGSTDQGGSTQDVALTSSNFIDTVTKAQADAGTTHVDMLIDAAGQLIKASGDVEIGDDPADSKMTMTMAMGSMGDMELRLVDQVLYMNMGQASQNKFAKIDLKDPNNPMGKTFGDLTGQMNPADGIKNFKGAITSFEKAGEPVKIDGVEAQPYDVVVDTAKIKGNLGSLAGGASLPDKITYKYWIGSDDLPRKLTSDLEQASTELTFTKWGEDVSIEAPAASEITDKSPFAGMPSTN